MTTACIVGGAGATGAVMGAGGKEYGGRWDPLMEWGVIRGGRGKFICGGY